MHSKELTKRERLQVIRNVFVTNVDSDDSKEYTEKHKKRFSIESFRLQYSLKKDGRQCCMDIFAIN